MRYILLCLLFSVLADPSSAQHDQHHQHTAEMGTSSLSSDDIVGLREGQGMGMAKPAELNGYPGPLHVLELADELNLTEDQRAEAQRLREAMLAEAQPLGERIIELEEQLDRRFQHQHVDADVVDQLTQEIGLLRGQLRAVHLKAHLGMYAAMSEEQRSRYADLRGYTSNQRTPNNEAMTEDATDGQHQH